MCFYKSSEKILKALKDKSDVEPDLIIFDEAHNTTGSTAKYHQALMDLTSEKKMFMATTPIELLFKNKDNIGAKYLKDLIFSMKNVDTYRETFFEYIFKNGIDDKINECFEYFDSVNFEKVLPNLFKFLTEEYSQVLVISQRDISHISDYQIKIKKENGYSRILN